MVTIFVKEAVKNFTNNNASGEILFEAIKLHLDRKEKVVVSFEGISGVSSSFVNSAFIELLNFYDFKYIQSHLDFKDSTKLINPKLFIPPISSCNY